LSYPAHTFTHKQYIEFL